MKKFEYQGKWALITGASSGIGAEYARSFAQRGANVFLVARNGEKLAAIAQVLQETYHIKADYLSLDLTKAESSQKLWQVTSSKNIKIEILVNNAGVGVHGLLHQTDLQRNQDQLMLNIYALSSLSQLYLSPMIEAKSGAIINIASTASFQPLPYMSNYAASKAFVRFFTEALWGECMGTGVRVLTVCPGPVETAFFDAMGTRDPAVGAIDSPENVVKQSLSALDRNKVCVIPGSINNRLIAQVSRLFSQKTTVKIAAGIMKPKTAKV